MAMFHLYMPPHGMCFSYCMANSYLIYGPLSTLGHLQRYSFPSISLSTEYLYVILFFPNSSQLNFSRLNLVLFLPISNFSMSFYLIPRSSCGII